MSTFFNVYEQELLDAFNTPKIKELAEADEFFYQKAVDKLDEFMNFDIANINIPELIETTKQANFSFERWLGSFSDESAEYNLLLLIGQLVSYFDTNAAMKNKLNEYNDKRVLAKAMVRQNIWVRWLLDFKMGKDINFFPGNIRNAIIFIQNPRENINIISDDYKNQIYDSFFEGENPDFANGLKSIGITTKNPQNIGVLFTWILYSDAFKSHWLPLKEVNASDNFVTIDELLARFKEFMSQKKQKGGTAHSYTAAMRCTLNYLGYNNDVPNVNISSVKEQIENLQDEFYNNPSSIMDKMKPYFLHAESYLKDGFVRASLPYFDNFIEYQNLNEQGTKKYSNAAFLRWFEPIIIALKNLGGIATPKEVREHIVLNMGLTKEFVNETRGKTKVKKFDNEVAFARNYLAYEGIIDKSKRGIWALTEKGMNVSMTTDVASTIFLKWVDILKERRENKLDGTALDNDTDYEQSILESIENIEEYNIENFFTEVYITNEKYNDIIALLKRKKNIILQGAPGVGKSYMAKRLAYSIIEAKDESKIEMIQFHQSYSYEDFIEGFRPNIEKDGKFDLMPGVFKKFCKIASYDLDNDYFFIIDEINRGNLSKIMGELMLLIEHDKRGEQFAMKLTYSGAKFYVPENIHIIGMMNTADRSLAMMDYALRRRFSFIAIESAYSNEKFIADFKAKYPDADSVINKMKKLNMLITEELDKGHEIGHSYFCSGEALNDKDIESIFKYEIEELLREYFFDNTDKLNEALRLINE